MKKSILLFIGLFFGLSNLFAQIDSKGSTKNFFSLKEALLTPETVVSLDLSNQKIALDDVNWELFVNLEYLSLKNDDLEIVPDGLSKLKKLKTLDLSGNNFKTLPSTLGGLSKLEVLYMNDEKQFDLENSIETISKMKSLKELHLENDNLKSLPKKFEKMSSLETLYLNDNNFIELPRQIMKLQHLKYLDLKNNKIDPNIPELKNLNFGFTLNLK
jgi:Leucine-rich repeat (LRR) protein